MVAKERPGTLDIIHHWVCETTGKQWCFLYVEGVPFLSMEDDV